MMIIFKDWLESFVRVFFIPITKTFIEEVRKAKGKLASAIIWLVLLTSFIHLFGYVYLNVTFPLLTTLIVIIVFPIIFLLYVYCVHLLYQRLFHRKKYLYDELLYVMVSIFVPFVLIDLYLSLIPHIGKLASEIAFLYPAILIIVAIKSICKLTAWQSLVTFILATILGGFGFFCIPVFLMSLMGTVPGLF